MEKLRILFVYINMWRIVPAYFIFKINRFHEQCALDFEQWKLYSTKPVEGKSNIVQFGYVMLYEKSCRNILLNRLHRNPLMYVVARIFFAPLDSCYINMPPENIAGVPARVIKTIEY